MTQPEAQGMCRTVDERMPDIIDGIADNATFDHMAGCERCRDARHVAEQALVRVADAAADYRVPQDLSAEVLGALARGDARPSRIPAAIGETLASVRGFLERRESSAPASPRSAPEPEPNGRAEGALETTRLAWVSLAAAVGLGVLWFGNRPEPGAPKAVAPQHGPAGAWQGQVLELERGFGSPSGLLECARGTQVCRPLAPGDSIHPGTRIETDGLTRALVRFSDGSRLSFDRQSRFELDPNQARRGRLLEGNLVVEIERQSPEPGLADPSTRASDAIIDLPLGRVEVKGTKFSLRARKEGARVEVSRGSVQLFDPDGRDVLLGAGEAARVEAGQAPRVENVLDLGAAFGWSKTASDRKSDPTEQGALGELVAKRPRDGQELSGAVRLTEHHIQARIVDNIARTEIEEVFENETDEVLEGIYRFPLPPRAQIERLALEVDGKLEEGAFVDRERALAIWRGAVVNAGGPKPPPSEDIVWVPGPWRDPALLEWQRGGRFELRIFPIPARGSRRIVLAYTEVLEPSDGGRTYVYPLPHDPRGSTKIARFTAEVQVRGFDPARGVEGRGYPLTISRAAPEVARLAYDASDFVPSGDLSVAYELSNPDAELRTWVYQPAALPRPAEPATPPSSAQRAIGTLPQSAHVEVPRSAIGTGDGQPVDAPFVALALRPLLPRRARAEPRDFVLVADTSRSMIGENYRRTVEVIGRIIRELDRSARVTVLGCDSTCLELPGGFALPGDATAEAALQFLERIEPEGASDLAFAVEQAVARQAPEAAPADPNPNANPERGLRVIYVGDGMPTVGPIHPALLERAIAEALPRGAALFAIAVGSDADRAALRVATRAGGGVSVAFTPGESSADVAYAVLGATYGHALEHARLELPEGLTAVLPEHLGSIAAGAEQLVMARMSSPRVQGDVVLRGDVAGEAFERRFTVELVATPGEANAFVPRLYAGMAIAELEASFDERARQHSIELSTRFNVASRYTSLLVLESPAMFSAFGLDRRPNAHEWSGDLESQKSESLAEPEEVATLGSAEATTSGSPRLERRGARAAAAPSRSPALSAQDADAVERSALGDSEVERARKNADDEPRESEFDAEPLEPVRRRRMIPMRRVWERSAKIEAPGALAAASTERREGLQLRVRDNAESRDALRALYVVDFLGADLEGAAQAAAHWAEKDPLDVDALTARADLAAQRGQRELAIRILGSVVDVRPGDYKAQWRLARLHRWAGHPERGCRHSLAVAQLLLRDAQRVSEAVGCARDVGQGRVADDLLAALEPEVRREVEQLVQRRRLSDELSGDFRVLGTWQGHEHDVDLAILNPEGYRVSWLGAPTRAVISANDVLSLEREGLALRGAPPGQYAIEVTRSSLAQGQIRGNLQVMVADRERHLPFVLDGERARVAIVTLRNQARLVPVDGEPE